MDTCIQADVRAMPARIFELAARIEEWPRLLPHYRWIHVGATHQSSQDAARQREPSVERPIERTVEMAARRQVLGPLGVPLWWRSIQRIDPDQMVVAFRHIDGITRGMSVTWTFEVIDAHTTRVSIRHHFAPAWPVPDWLVHLVVGEYFVNGVARRTLRLLGDRAERSETHR